MIPPILSEQHDKDEAHAITLSGSGKKISIDDVVAVANGQLVRIDPDCAVRLEHAHLAMLHAAESGAAIYGLSTGVGALKGVIVKQAQARSFNRHLILSHRVSHGKPVPRRIVRATMFCHAQGLTLGRSGVRPAVVTALIEALNADDIPHVRMLGSVGQGDLAQLADIAEALIKRGLILEERDNPGAVDPEVYMAHPSSELEQSVKRLRHLLAGSALLEGREAPRLLQDPLSLRVAPQTHATARRTLRHAREVVEGELTAAADNPLVTADGRVISVGNFDASGLAAALDYARIGLAHVLTLSCERTQKLLSGWHTGLPTGLREREDVAEDALALFGHGAAALAAEARLLAHPVSFELPTSSVAESVEDRVTMAPLGARRLDEQAELALRLATIELVCAAQAIDLRQRLASLGPLTRTIHAFVRSYIPFVRASETPVTDLDNLVTALASDLGQTLQPFYIIDEE